MESEELKQLMKMYEQPWRHHHTWRHVDEMREAFLKRVNKSFDMNVFDYAIIFHDCVYEPLASDNEEKSNEKWKEYAGHCLFNKDFTNAVSNLILSTKHPEKCSTREEIAFRNLDWHDMGVVHDINDKYARWLEEYERNIFREFQKVSVEEYVKGRGRFLLDSVKKGLMTEEVAQYLLPLVNRKKTVGIYAGSFNPFHVGHLNILKKAEQMFDKVIVARGVNPEKKDNKIYGDVADFLSHHQVDKYDCQLVDYVNSKRSEYVQPVLIRGLRNGYDLNQEVNLISFVNAQADDRGIERVPIMYIHCDKEYEHVSSSAVRMLEENDAKRYIPEIK